MNSEIRIGKVSSINYECGMASVTYQDKDNSVTAECPIVTNNDEYIMPKIGQDVLVAHLSNGSSRGVIIGTVWNKKHFPQESGEKIYRKELSRKKDAAYIRYSDETGEYLIKVANLHLNGVNKTILDGPRLEISANIELVLESEEIRVKGSDALINFLENIEILAGTEIQINADEKIEVKSGTDLKLSGTDKTEIETEGELRFTDGKYSVTLSEIMEILVHSEE